MGLMLMSCFGKARPMLTLPWSIPRLQTPQGSFLPIFSWTQKMPNQKWNIAPYCGVPGMKPDFSVLEKEKR